MKRSRLEIISSILIATGAGASKTQIVYRSNLNFKLANDLLTRLLKAGYLELERPVKGRPQFRTTTKGFAFLHEIKSVHEEASPLLATTRADTKAII